MERVTHVIDTKYDSFFTLALDCIHQRRLSPIIIHVFFNTVLVQECLNELNFGTDTSEMKGTTTAQVLSIDVGIVVEDKVKHEIGVIAVLADPKKDVVNLECVVANYIIDRFQVIIVNSAQ